MFTEAGPLIVLGVAVALLLGIAGPASAQFFNFGGPPRPHRAAADSAAVAGSAATLSRHSSSRRRRQRVLREDFSKAPPPEKREAVAERNVLVLGDAMADWLAYGLEDAYADQPDMGVIRKAKTSSGLIKYQPKGDPADWAAAAKGILATEKPDAIVVMLGLNDRDRDPRAGGRKVRQDGRQEEREEGRQGQTATAKPADGQARCRGAEAQSPTTRRSTPNCRRTTPTTTRRRSSRRKRARARRTACMNSARNAGSNSTPRRSKR